MHCMLDFTLSSEVLEICAMAAVDLYPSLYTSWGMTQILLNFISCICIKLGYILWYTLRNTGKVFDKVFILYFANYEYLNFVPCMLLNLHLSDGLLMACSWLTEHPCHVYYTPVGPVVYGSWLDPAECWLPWVTSPIINSSEISYLDISHPLFKLKRMKYLGVLV